jgi:hypothetical protein
MLPRPGLSPVSGRAIVAKFDGGPGGDADRGGALVAILVAKRTDATRAQGSLFRIYEIEPEYVSNSYASTSMLVARIGWGGGEGRASIGGNPAADRDTRAPRLLLGIALTPMMRKVSP